jgi:hypothetical protein
MHSMHCEPPRAYKKAPRALISTRASSPHPHSCGRPSSGSSVFLIPLLQPWFCRSHLHIVKSMHFTPWPLPCSSSFSVILCNSCPSQFHLGTIACSSPSSSSSGHHGLLTSSTVQAAPSPIYCSSGFISPPGSFSPL